MIVGTAGHIDHGKTALIKALTGVDADRLAEEKARGITIDLGYAYSPLADEDMLGFVDVPGHEKFIHNMLAGITGIDFALLVVAADDGPMPQTLEHLQILDLLGIARGVVALTKTDLAGAERIEKVSAEIQDLLKGTSLAGAPIISVSAFTGHGVAELRAYLESASQSYRLLNATIFPSRGEGWEGDTLERSSKHRGQGQLSGHFLPSRPSHARGRILDLSLPRRGGGFRLAVDRCFSVAGAGTVVTGTVFSGQVRVGDRLLLSPCGLPARVRGIHAQNRLTETGTAGQRCALNLTDVEKNRIQRGDWMLAPELHRPTTRLDVRLRLLASEAKPLKHWTPAHVHLGAFHATGRVALFRDEPLNPGESALGQLVLDKPTCAVLGDRLILRDASALRTIGGGQVLDAEPPARGRRSRQRLEILAAWEQADPQATLLGLLAVSPQGIDLTSFAANVNLTGEELNLLLGLGSIRVVRAGRPLAFASEHWEALRETVVAALQSEHENVPDSLGLNAEQLRLRCAPRMERPAFAELLAGLLEGGACARDGSWWHLPGHDLVLAEKDEVLWQRLSPLLKSNPFQPPRVRDIARAEALDEGNVRRLLSQAARLGRLYRVAHDHYFDRAAVAEMAHIVRELARDSANGVLAASFRDRIGTGRKLAIHILEFFDRTGLTRRVGDEHRIRNGSLQF